MDLFNRRVSENNDANEARGVYNALHNLTQDRSFPKSGGNVAFYVDLDVFKITFKFDNPENVTPADKNKIEELKGSYECLLAFRVNFSYESRSNPYFSSAA